MSLHSLDNKRNPAGKYLPFEHFPDGLVSSLAILAQILILQRLEKESVHFTSLVCLHLPIKERA